MKTNRIFHISFVFLEIVFMFCSFQVLNLQIPLFFYENGGGFSAIALCVEKMLPPNMYPLITLVCLAAFHLHTPDIRLKLWEKMFCCAFSLFLMIGDSYAAIDSWDLVFGSSTMLLLSAATLLGLTATIHCGLKYLKYFVPKFLKKELPIPALWEKHPFLFAWTVIFLCWLPYILVRLPAAIEHDAYGQIEEAFGFRLCVIPVTDLFCDLCIHHRNHEEAECSFGHSCHYVRGLRTGHHVPQLSNRYFEGRTLLLHECLAVGSNFGRNHTPSQQQTLLRNLCRSSANRAVEKQRFLDSLGMLRCLSRLLLNQSRKQTNDSYCRTFPRLCPADSL